MRKSFRHNRPSAPQQPATPRWKTETATNHTKLAHSERTQKQWAAVASDVHAKTGDRGQAVHAANYVERETVARDLVRPIARSPAQRKAFIKEHYPDGLPCGQEVDQSCPYTHLESFRRSRIA